MSATLLKIGDDTVSAASIYRLTVSPQAPGTYMLKINNSGTPSFTGTRKQCLVLRDIVLEYLEGTMGALVLDLNVDYRDRMEEESNLEV